MKTILYIIVFAFSITGSQLQAQDKISESKIEVPGVCKMCKARIEEAALRSKGVKTAEWDQNTKLLSVIYRNDKTSKEEIQAAVDNVGHGYNLKGVDSVAYKNLPYCCLYHDNVKDH